VSAPPVLRFRALLLLAVACCLGSLGAPPALADSLLADSDSTFGEQLAAGGDLEELSLEQLGNVEVTSVSHRIQRLSDAPTSIYVITQEDIRRSGAKTIPEALRLAPTLEVARADANQYAITARGFNSVLANKLLVMIDGRTVYSPLFSGVFWEAQDLLLEDVDRIEVISGPGGTTWGTNAVNGVINIITRPASETKGVHVLGAGGNDLRVAQARYGWGNGPHLRAYAKYTDQDHSTLTTGAAVRDASERVQGGGRARWVKGAHTFFLDSGGYRNRIDQGPAPQARDVSGFHALGTWQRHPHGGSSLQLQAYYERTRRDQPGTILDLLDTWDLAFHQQLRDARRSLVWGAGYRYQDDRVSDLGPGIDFRPDDRILRSAHLFAEGAIAVDPRFELTAGGRLERNEYTDWEFLPTVRAAWRVRASHLLWLAGSRAVRAPSRVDREFFSFSPANPSVVFLAGGPEFRSEILRAAELGYRGQPYSALSYTVCAFGGAYDRLRSIEPGPSGPVFANSLEGTIHGAEAWANYRVATWWRLSAGGVAQRVTVQVKNGEVDLGGRSSLGIDPEHWWSLRSALDLGPRAELDLMIRQVGALPISQVPNYTTLDGRLAWRFLPSLETSVVGRNLVGPRHPEWGTPASRVAHGRSVYGQLQWRL
jgi:iron complex outermembrane recepter protein